MAIFVIGYPMPPNVTIGRLLYSGRQRTDVNIEWSAMSDKNLTGFLIERTCDVMPDWHKVTDDLDPRIYSYHVANLDPSVKYKFRVTAVNRRTFGNPSETMSPGKNRNIANLPIMIHMINQYHFKNDLLHYLTVPMPVSKPYIVLSDNSAEEGTSVWMSCGLGNGTEPIHYTWKLETPNGSVTILAESNNSLMSITRVSRNHTGWYRCLARNEINQQSSDQMWLDILCECNIVCEEE